MDLDYFHQESNQQRNYYSNNYNEHQHQEAWPYHQQPPQQQQGICNPTSNTPESGEIISNNPIAGMLIFINLFHTNSTVRVTIQCVLLLISGRPPFKI
jgi:hypothetical protein